MSSKTKIVVLRMKELIYTAIFVALGILVIILLISMFRKDNTAETSTTVGKETSYTPGVYSSSISINNQSIDMAVTVDSDHINSIQFVNLEESITTMYPLMQTSLDALSSQILENQSTENVTYPEESKYTSQVLLNAIESALAKATTEAK